MRGNDIIERTEKGVKESNKILIQELIQDLEEKGIKPVVAINGEVKKLNLINENELDDFYKSISDKGLDEDDFCVLEVDKSEGNNDESKGDGPTIQGAVIVVNKKIGKTKEYKAVTSWVADFAADLENNFFQSN